MQDLTNRLLNYPKEEKGVKTEYIFFAIIIVLFFCSYLMEFVYSPVKVIGTSMYPTINDGEWLIMNNVKQETRGDIVVIKATEEKDYIKRLIALPGDTVHIVGEKVYVKEKGTDEFYLLDYGYYFGNGNNEGYEITLILKDDEIFVLGDNRNNSTDSRARISNPFKTDDILGVVPSWAIEKGDELTKYFEKKENNKEKLIEFFEKVKKKIKEVF